MTIQSASGVLHISRNTTNGDVGKVRGSPLYGFGRSGSLPGQPDARMTEERKD